MSDNDAASISLRDRAVAEVGRFLDDYITERLDQGLLKLSFRGDARIRAEFCQLCRDSEVKEYVADIFIFNNTVRTAVSDSPALQYKLMDKRQYDYENYAYAGTRRARPGGTASTVAVENRRMVMRLRPCAVEAILRLRVDVI